MSRKLFPQFFSVRQTAIVSVILTLIALGIRLIGLSLDSLWFDEVFSVRAGRISVSDIIILTRGDVHPPLYYLLLHFWMKLFGETEIAVRMLSVIFSVLTVFVVYHLALKLFNRRTAFFAALFTTLSPLQVFYAQETRMYAQLTFLAAASVYFYVCWLKEGTRLSYAFYLISTTLLLYTHIYAVFVVMAQLLYFVWLRLQARETFRKRLRGWLAAQLITGLLFLPWALIIFQQATRARRGFWIREPDWLTPLSTLIEYCGSLWLAALLLPLFVYGVKLVYERSGKEKTASLPRVRVFLLLWLILPIIIPFMLSKLVTPFYLAKYTIAASLPFYLLAARGLEQVRGRLRQAVLLLLICLCFGLELSKDLISIKRERWNMAAYNVESAAQANDLVLFNSTGSYMSFAYYARRKDIEMAVFPYSATDEQPTNDLTLLQRAAGEGFGSVHPPQTEQETEDRLKKIVGNRSRVWIVTRYGEGFRNDFIKVFGNEFRATAQPALCFNQRRFLFTENYSETDSAIFLQQRGLGCSSQVYLLER
ncbi:MAG TPA: glycosyltransferase family 39 protein [Pyrinomonadaceae bacterium]|jgi:4-amino-4-deoxy-L-arabinose transferase-like glycosyltransferase